MAYHRADGACALFINIRHFMRLDVELVVAGFRGEAFELRGIEVVLGGK